MGISSETWEKVFKTVVETYLTDRPVLYGDERRSQKKTPYATVKLINTVSRAITYSRYYNRAEDPDLDQQLVRPVNLVFSVNFIGGNAVGDLDEMLTKFWDPEVYGYMTSEGLGYNLDSGVRDITEAIGGDREKRAQTDITCSAHILPDRSVVPSIQEVQINAEYKDSAASDVYENTITIKDGA